MERTSKQKIRDEKNIKAKDWDGKKASKQKIGRGKSVKAKE